MPGLSPAPRGGWERLRIRHAANDEDAKQVTGYVRKGTVSAPDDTAKYLIFKSSGMSASRSASLCAVSHKVEKP
jgi:hypothetical protein